jgi:hypothetical protein
MAFALGLSSCQKEKKSQTTENATIKIGLSQKPHADVVPVNYSYVDLTLMPRAPGVTYDTYHCTWLAADIYVTSVFWDSATYPITYNGVPLYGTVSTNPANSLTYATADGKEGTAFVVVLPTLCGAPSSKLGSDIAYYETALDDFAGVGTIPNLNDFVVGDYGTGAGCHPVTYNLRLIRCTTGTGYAVATANYPFTYVTPGANVHPMGGPITDPKTNITYLVQGEHGRVTTIQTYTGAAPGFSIVGTYSFVPNSSLESYSGTVTRPDGTTFVFNVVDLDFS